MDLFNAITSSEKRKALLILLFSGPKSWEEIRERLKFPSAAIIPQVRILEKCNLIFRENGQYLLTPIGKVVAKPLNDLISVVGVLEKEIKFWREHDIDKIPDQFLFRLGELGNVAVDESPVEGIFQPKKEFLVNLSDAKTIHGLSHTVHPLYPSLFLDLIKEGKKISLILTRPAFDHVKDKYSSILDEWLDFDGTEMSIIEDEASPSFVVTDKYISLQLFLTNGTFDPTRDIFSYDQRAILWGEKLFEFYRGKSTLVR